MSRQYRECNYINEIDESIVAEIIDKNSFSNTPAISVVVVTYNRRKTLIDNLEALKKQTVKNFEIVLIDNNDKMDIKGEVLKYDIKYVKMKKNYRHLTARNISAKLSKADIIIFLDDDAIPASNFVEQHILAHKENDIFGLRGICFPKTKSIYNNSARHYNLGEHVINHPIDLEGNSSFKRNFFIEIGGFNPELKTCGGIDLTFRTILKYGDESKFIYTPKAIIYHDYSDSLAKYIKKKLLLRKYRKILRSKFPNFLIL